MKQPLSNFPRGFYLTLLSSRDRQEFMNSQLKDLGISTINPLISPRFKAAQDVVTGKYAYQLDDGTKGCVVSHLKALKLCLERYSDPYFFICEDDFRVCHSLSLFIKLERVGQCRTAAVLAGRQSSPASPALFFHLDTY